ncbi:MAG: general secretion pathway protein GspB [Phycisphaerales bacterium]
MNLARRTKDRLMVAGVLVGPIACVLLVRIGTGLQPQSSAAATAGQPQAAALAAPGTPAALTPGQMAAAAYVAARPVPVVARSPMAFIPSEPTDSADAQTLVSTDDPQDERPIDAPTLALSTIYSGAASAAAIINGRVYRAGDTVAKGWTVREIDRDQMAVVIDGPGGRALRLTQPRKN